MEQPTRVLIVGGGVIGCSIAYFLRKRNVNVIVVEKGAIGAQASGAAAGLLAPIRPLSQEDPFKTFQLAAIARFPLFVPELEDASGLTIGYQQTGTLRVLPPEKLVSARRWAEAWQKAGYRIDVLTPKEALAREPLLFPGLHGAASIADEAQVVPAQLVKALAQAARRAGAFIYDHTEVIALERSESGESIKGAWTIRGELLRCDHLVIAAGTWSAKLGEWLSVPLPIRIVSNDDDRFMIGIEREWEVRDSREQLLKMYDFNDVNGALRGRWHGDGGEFAIERRFLFVKVLPGPLAIERFITANRVNVPVAV